MSHTNAEVAVVLVKRHKVHRGHDALLWCMYGGLFGILSITAELGPPVEKSISCAMGGGR